MAVASHNQTAFSYLYTLQKLVTFSGLPHFKNDSPFFVTQTHHPIPALAHEECGAKASGDGQAPQEYAGSGEQPGGPRKGWELSRPIAGGQAF